QVVFLKLGIEDFFVSTSIVIIGFSKNTIGIHIKFIAHIFQFQTSNFIIAIGFVTQIDTGFKPGTIELGLWHLQIDATTNAMTIFGTFLSGVYTYLFQI